MSSPSWLVIHAGFIAIVLYERALDLHLVTYEAICIVSASCSQLRYVSCILHACFAHMLPKTKAAHSKHALLIHNISRLSETCTYNSQYITDVCPWLLC